MAKANGTSSIQIREEDLKGGCYRLNRRLDFFIIGAAIPGMINPLPLTYTSLTFATRGDGRYALVGFMSGIPL
jgi:hypothetical protein